MLSRNIDIIIAKVWIVNWCIIHLLIVLSSLVVTQQEYLYVIQARNWKNILSYFSTKTYVVGTHKNRLNETVLMSTQNRCLNWWIRK